VPTLRNVALRRSFYHNGVFHNLEEAVTFYATRETSPERWYARKPDGTVAKYDDLPAQYAYNIEQRVPFKPLPDGSPRLSENDVKDIVAFLRTLSDGYCQRK
jgi:cytochrome c peroxidase